jgi:microcompartment protein CcmL/EutN
MMKGKALGLLETYGYIGAIEAVDACLKAADVELIGLEFVRGGLVTIKICGDVSAVKASIDAGAVAADRVGKVISIDVIARMGEGLEKIIYMPKKDKEIKAEVQNEITGNDEIAKEPGTYAINEPQKSDAVEAEELKAIEEDMNSPYDSDIIETAFDEEGDTRTLKNSKNESDTKYIINYKGKAINIRDENELINMKVVDLRRIARRVNGISIEKSQIAFAKKSELIEALTKCFNKEEE